MGFGTGSRARLWSITEDANKYANCSISTNAKVGDEWKKDFSSKYVRFVGEAYKKLKSINIPEKGINIRLTSCASQNVYQNKEGKDTFLKNDRHIVFDFEWIDGEQPTPAPSDDAGSGFMDMSNEEDIPFV